MARLPDLQRPTPYHEGYTIALFVIAGLAAMMVYSHQMIIGLTAGDEGADDADDDVAEQAESATLDDEAGEPARDRADDKPNDDRFNAHEGSPMLPRDLFLVPKFDLRRRRAGSCRDISHSTVDEKSARSSSVGALPHVSGQRLRQTSLP